MGGGGTNRPPTPVPICFRKQRPNHGTHTLAAFTMRILIDYQFLHASLESSHNAEFPLNVFSGLSTVLTIVQECNQIAKHGKLLESGRPRVKVKVKVRLRSRLL